MNPEPVVLSAEEISKRVRQFLGNLQESEIIYRRLADLGREQGRVLDAGDPEELMSVARSKECEMARLEIVEEAGREIRASWSAIQESVPEVARQAVREAAARVETVLRGLLALEKQQRQSILEQKEATLENIRRLEAGRRVQRAYGGGASSVSGFLDQRE